VLNGTSVTPKFGVDPRPRSNDNIDHFRAHTRLVRININGFPIGRKANEPVAEGEKKQRTEFVFMQNYCGTPDDQSSRSGTMVR
jgi:hypothetical protein